MIGVPGWLRYRVSSLSVPGYWRIRAWYVGTWIAFTAVGVIGFIGDVSPSVARFGGWPTHLWSLLFVTAGVLGTVCRIRGYLLAEAALAQATGAMLALWGGAILVGAGRGSTQAAVAFIAAGGFMWAWAASARLWVVRERMFVETTLLAQARLAQLEGHLTLLGHDTPEWTDPTEAATRDHMGNAGGAPGDDEQEGRL